MLLRGHVLVAYPDEYLEIVADRLLQSSQAHLPVISRSDSSLVGYLGWKDLMRAKTKLREEETSRKAFLYPWPRDVRDGAISGLLDSLPLCARGFSACRLKDGLPEWRATGLTVVAGSARSSTPLTGRTGPIAPRRSWQRPPASKAKTGDAPDLFEGLQ